jgi:DNA primase
VIVEGPLDAIAVTAAGEGRFAGVAPCGTAFTPEQLGELARACDLSATGVLAAFDADEAGQRAAVHAYTLLADATERPMTVAFSAGEDPASVFTKNGRKALRLVLDNLARPLADVVIDARISRFDRSLEFIEGKFNALASVAPIIADMTPREWPRQAIRVAARLGIAPVEVSDAVIRAMSDARGESPARAGPSRRKASCLAAGDTTELVVSAVLTGTSQGRQERRADVSARPTTSPRQVQRTGRGR